MCCTKRRSRQNDGGRLFPVTFTASQAWWCMKKLYWGWRQVNHPPWTHVTLPAAAQTQIQCNQRRDRPLLLLSLHSDPFYYPLLSSSCLSLYAFLCPLQTEGFCHLNFLLFIQGHLGIRPRACLSAWPDPDSPLYGWKNERLTAGQRAPYASCVRVNRSETVTLPSSKTGAYTSGVSKHSHGGMNK